MSQNRITHQPSVDVSNVARAEFIAKLQHVDIPRLLAHVYSGGADVLEAAVAHIAELERQRAELVALARREQVTGQSIDPEALGCALADIAGEKFTAV